jgi:hypothetical protein
MAQRSPTRERATGSRPAWPTSRAVRAAALPALLSFGLLAAIALAPSHSAQAQPQGPTTTSVSTTGNGGSSSATRGVWMTFEANPPSFVLRPLRKFAACVRRHGVPGLPDPKVVDRKVVLLLPRGLTPKSPQLKRARHACRKLLPQGSNTSHH